jgi:hypothetical protein
MATPEQGERITLADRLARIETKLDIYLERQSCIDADVAALKIKAGEMQRDLNTHGVEIHKLRERDNVTGIMAALGAFGAALAGIFVKGP